MANSWMGESPDHTFPASYKYKRQVSNLNFDLLSFLSAVTLTAHVILKTNLEMK